MLDLLLLCTCLSIKLHFFSLSSFSVVICMLGLPYITSDLVFGSRYERIPLYASYVILIYDKKCLPCYLLAIVGRRRNSSCWLLWLSVNLSPPTNFKQFCLINFTVYLHPYSLQHTPLQLLDKKHFAKLSRQPIQNGSAVASQNNENLKQVALMEAKIEKLCDLLDEVSFWEWSKCLFDYLNHHNLYSEKEYFWGLLNFFYLWPFSDNCSDKRQHC